MSTITATSPRSYANTSTQTMSFEEIVEQKVAERLKERQSSAESTLEQLRPLCEELPNSALDPITFNPMKIPLVMRCSHTLSADAVGKIAQINNFTKKDLIECPICRVKTQGYFFLYDQAFGETIEHLEKIKRIFEDYASEKQTGTEESPPEKKSRK